MLTYVCSSCGLHLAESALIAVDNPDWEGGSDQECCPACENLCIAVDDEDENEIED